MSEHIGDLLKKYGPQQDPSHAAVLAYLKELCGDGLSGFTFKNDVLEIYVKSAGLAGQVRFSQTVIRAAVSSITGVPLKRVAISIRV